MNKVSKRHTDQKHKGPDGFSKCHKPVNPSRPRVTLHLSCDTSETPHNPRDLPTCDGLTLHRRRGGWWR